MKSYLNQLYDHLYWADKKLFEALPKSTDSMEAFNEEFAHVIGAEEIWLARIEKRTPACKVWPAYQKTSIAALMYTTHDTYSDLLKSLSEESLDYKVDYVNSVGLSFSNKLSDILLHVCLHGQYHRGKVNLHLRNKGFDPAPVDFIAFVRGTPAATQEDR